METQVVTQERPQPLEPKLRLDLLKSYLVQRWQCGIKQGEEWDCSSKRIVDVVYDFPLFFSFSFWTLLRARLCWSTWNRLCHHHLKLKAGCFYEAGNTTSPKAARVPGWRRTEGSVPISQPGTHVRAQGAPQSPGSAPESFGFLRHTFQRLRLRSRIPQSDENVPLNRYNHRVSRTVCGCTVIFPFPGESGAI